MRLLAEVCQPIRKNSDWSSHLRRLALALVVCLTLNETCTRQDADNYYRELDDDLMS